MKYLGKKFSSPANSQTYVDNWDAIFSDPVLKDDVTQEEASTEEQDVMVDSDDGHDNLTPTEKGPDPEGSSPVCNVCGVPLDERGLCPKYL